MKKLILTAAIAIAFTTYITTEVKAEMTEPVVKIEIPASSVNTIDVKYEKQDTSAISKVKETTKETTDKTIKATKKATKKTVNATKKAAKTTTEKTKDVTDKTVKATKDFTDKTVDSTKELIEELNPNKPVTLEGLELDAQIKTLKNEKKELKAAYNSRIKDINAKIKATGKSTLISDVQKQNKIYTLNKQKKELEIQRDTAMQKYDAEIAKLKTK